MMDEQKEDRQPSWPAVLLAPLLAALIYAAFCLAFGHSLKKSLEAFGLFYVFMVLTFLYLRFRNR
jgi:hypothetical protein